MNISENKLRSLVEAEIAVMIENGEIDEGFLDRLKARGASGMKKVKGAAQGAVQKGLGAAATGLGKLGAGDAVTKVGTDLKQAAADTKSATAAGAQSAKIKSILQGHLKNLQTDLTKLGIGGDVRVRKALQSIEAAVTAAAAQT